MIWTYFTAAILAWISWKKQELLLTLMNHLFCLGAAIIHVISAFTYHFVSQWLLWGETKGLELTVKRLHVWLQVQTNLSSTNSAPIRVWWCPPLFTFINTHHFIHSTHSWVEDWLPTITAWLCRAFEVKTGNMFLLLSTKKTHENMKIHNQRKPWLTFKSGWKCCHYNDLEYCSFS